MAELTLCERCQHFEPALDPFIQKVYMGYCLKIEWPFARIIPTGGVPVSCDFFEQAERVKVVERVAPVEVVTAVAAAGIGRVEFYYSTQDTPSPQYFCNIQKALELCRQLQERGIEVKVTDMAEFTGDLFPIYNAAVTGPSSAKRSVFGTKGALEAEFGTTVPALLVYTNATDRSPTEVFPRMDRELNRLVGVEEALEKLLAG